MELSERDAGVFAGWLLSIGAIFAWVKLTIKAHGRRIARVERRFFTENDEPALLSYRAHNHICQMKNEVISKELRHVVEAMNKNSQTVKDNSDQVAELTIAVAVLEEKVVKE